MKRTLNYDGMNPVIMLCRNALELTKQAVRSVLEQDIPVHLHIVNNKSTDGTEEWLDESGIEHTDFDPPLGVSSGWNYALVNAFRIADHCLVVNNDIYLKPSNYRELLEDGGEFVTGVSVDNMEALNGEWRKSPRPHPDFSNFLIRRSVWENVGAFDERFSPAYYEDNDYHIRMHQAGVEAYTIGIPFYHYASGTLKFASEADSFKIRQAADISREKFFAKWKCYPGTPEYDALFRAPLGGGAYGTNGITT